MASVLVFLIMLGVIAAIRRVIFRIVGIHGDADFIRISRVPERLAN